MLLLCMAGVGVGLLLTGLFLAVFRARAETLNWTVTLIGLALLTVAVGWSFLEQLADRDRAFLERLADRDRADERRALDRRMQELAMRATVPGSLLGCLDVSAGEALRGACEKALFAGPETVTAAVALVAARLSLLADAVEYAGRVDASYGGSIVGLRRAIENDAFGIAAHVLATWEGCTNLNCERLALLSDATRVSANLRDGTFDALVTRYASGWVQAPRPGTPVAAGTAAVPGRPVTGLNFPSAASIPPISIMTGEPQADAAAPTNPPASPSHPADAPRSPAGHAQKSSPSGPPIQLGAPAVAGVHPPAQQP